MLKRTMMLLSLTITVGALLLVVGCGGSNSTMPTVSESSSGPSRGWKDSQLTLNREHNPVTATLEDPDGILSITVRDSNGSRVIYAPRGSKTFTFPLPNFGKVSYVVGLIDGGVRVDSIWVIYEDGTVVRR